MSTSLAWTISGTWPIRRSEVDRPVTERASGVQTHQVMVPLISEPALADLSEIALVAACVAGRSGAFDLVVERHRRSVYQLCYRFVGNHEDASDLSQDVFLRAHRGLKNFRAQSSIATWLYRIGVNVCLNRVSAKQPIVEAIDAREFEDTGAESPSERMLRAERGARVRAAIRQLPPKQ